MNVFRKKWLLVFFSIFYAFNLFAKDTIIKGKVLDSESSEPLPFVHLYFQGTNIASTTDIDGEFYMKIDTDYSVLTVSYMGYITQKVNIKTGEVNELNIILVQDIVNLKEVIVKPDYGPIKRLLSNIQKNIERNNPDNYPQYNYRRYTRWDYRINNVSDNMTKWRVFDNSKSIFKYDSDSTRYLPVYFSEQIVFNQYRKNPLMLKSTVEADNTFGLGLLSDTEISGMTAGLDVGVNFYSSSMEMFNQNFISPLHPNGWFYYNYFLIDSTKQDNHLIYKVRFRPKRAGDNTFTGEMDIESSNYSIVNINTKLNNLSHLNFIKGLEISVSYKMTQDSLPFYDRSQIISTIDYMPVELSKNRQRVELKSYNTMIFTDVDLNPDKSFKLSHRRLSYESTRDIGYSSRDDDYWNRVRPTELNDADIMFIQAIDSMNNLPFIKLLDKVAQMSLTGYYNIGKFELGPYDYMLSFNKVEGTHLYFGGRTSSDLFKNFSIWAGIGYGTKNREWLGRIGFGYILPTSRRSLIQLEYTDDMIQIGENEKILYLYENKQHTSESNLISYIFKREDLFEIFRRERALFSFEKEIRTGLTVKSALKNQNFFSPYFFPFKVNEIELSSFNNKEYQLNFRWSWEEKYLDYGYRRIYLSTPKPIVNLSLSVGENSVGDRKQSYVSTHSSIKHYFYLGQTKLDYALEAGYIFGKVPYPLLDIPRANITYGFTSYNYNMVNSMEFMHDKYIHGYVEYRLNGLVFKRVPLLKKMGIREVFSFKSMIGGLDNKHFQLLDSPKEIYEYNNKPYLEVGLGAENIFRFFRLDGVWRVTDTRDAPKFGLRARMELKF